MTTIVTVETLALILLALLVAGLLRSHAEILRRLEALDPGTSPAEPRLAEELPAARTESSDAFDIVGSTPDGDAVKIAVTAPGRGDTLLAFLSTGCIPCRPFWDGLRMGGAAGPGLPAATRIVVVTKDSQFESPSKLRELAPTDAPVVQSSAAWEAYRVQGSPYFILVDGATGTIAGEGTAGGWPQVLSLLRDAVEDATIAATSAGGGGGKGPGAGNGNGHARGRRDDGPDRLRRADQEFRLAGIGPGHPSLYGRAGGEVTPDETG